MDNRKEYKMNNRVNEDNREKGSLISKIDVQIVLSAGLCVALAGRIPEFQAMTACITTLLCVQEGTAPSWKAGLVRLLVTAVGGLAGILTVFIDELAGLSRPAVPIVTAGLLLTLFGCKLARAPLFNARIGGVTFILVVLTKTGPSRIYYSFFRLLSTLYGVMAVITVTAVFSFIEKRLQNLHK
jgi:uncharacterized membrane protein YgaE (UPF0421/DUF939 family)